MHRQLSARVYQQQLPQQKTRLRFMGMLKPSCHIDDQVFQSQFAAALNFFAFGLLVAFVVSLMLLALGHMLTLLHSLHLGPLGLHTCWPNPTISRLISPQVSRGSQASTDLRVSSADLVVHQPSRLSTRWQWLSTPMPTGC
eukprot:TRINITY_DN9237_c0_g1_i1.p1 TRINITY_DN9237_c0_g1~~TRINITY_DN9237_c0_g1_i1.p1  ORF type:complete len:141 (+),score=5.23 TRINITY_DN9237_c0_g1_i1:983-1405(+)